MTSKHYQVKTTNGDKPMCNICRQADQLDNLMTPCFCFSDIAYVHFQCIKIWIEVRRGYTFNDNCLYLHKNHSLQVSGNDQCASCKKSFSKGLIISKQAGRFGKFFYHSEMGRVYSHFLYLFLVMFYLSYLGQFHSRLAYHFGWISSSVVITAMNCLYLIIQTIIFFIYLVMVYIAFIHWRKTHFDIEVKESNPKQPSKLP